MKTRYYIILAVVSYLIFTLALTPASSVISLVKQQTNIPLQLYGVSGSIWNGQADSLIIPGRPRIDQLQWQLNPAALLLARISADIQASVNQHQVSGHVSLNSSGQLSAHDVHSRLKAEDVQKLLKMPLGELAGEFDVSIESLQWQDQKLPKITANIHWRNAILTMAETVDLGNIELQITPDKDNGLSAKLANTGGMIQLKGSAQISDNKQYKINLQFTPQASVNENIKQNLGFIAKRQSDGSYRFKQNGNLRQLGL